MGGLADAGPSLMEDYQPLVIPSRLSMLVQGHTANVKCVDALGLNMSLAVSGSRYVNSRVMVI